MPDDWPGIFIRGDNALAWALTLEHGPDDWLKENTIKQIVALLNSCDERRDPKVQQIERRKP
jgi:hypothetical protein